MKPLTATYTPKDELTLSEEWVSRIADRMCEGGFHHMPLLFQSKANRDAVYKEAKRRGAILRRRSTGHTLLDPRYTVEGGDIPDRGLGNAYDTSYATLYELERVA